MLNPMLLSLLAGGASSLLGGNQMSGEQRRQLRFQNNIAQKLYGYSQGVPGSDPQEAAALAQAQAQLGESQLQQRNQLYAALGANQGSGNLGDLLSNLGSQQTAQRMSLESQHLLNALSQRHQALMQASGVGMNAAQLAGQQGQPNQLPQLFGNLASAMAYQQAMKTTKPAGAGGAGLPAGTTITGFGPQPSTGAGAAQAFRPYAGSPIGPWSLPGQGGFTARGNEPGGANAQDNINRQSMMLGNPLGGVIDTFRSLLLSNGVRLG